MGWIAIFIDGIGADACELLGDYTRATANKRGRPDHWSSNCGEQ